jgi:RHH-type proline utilization regulon transcriptional repressor/proline dehydrogenase/delta 1-pyrroline-5-carboxylate dehydrogenase
MPATNPTTRPCPLPSALAESHLADEVRCIERLLDDASFPAEVSAAIGMRAAGLVRAVREGRGLQRPLDALLGEYGLASEEGVLLMCLAEGLLRIPDAATADSLIRDKLVPAHWDAHIGRSPSLLVNAATWGLLLGGRVLALGEMTTEPSAGRILARLITRGGEPFIRCALNSAMHLLAGQFVMGRDIDEALRRAAEGDAARYRYSFDMLGEAALTRRDAASYRDAYARAIVAAGRTAGGELLARTGVSVKLSALHPRCEHAQRRRALPELAGVLAELAALAHQHAVPLTVDAEEAHRLELTLEVFAAALADPRLSGWEGLGLAVQAYQKRAPAVLEWLSALAAAHHCRIPVRLVKGAYWDYEIKRAQQLGLANYPVYTRKAHSDLAFLACARRLLGQDRLYPQFATHNAHTVAAILYLAHGRAFEFQRLHGMGEALYHGLVRDGIPCRVYAPVGSHRELLPYLVRRLLENGANASFVHRIADPHIPVEMLTADPAQRVRTRGIAPHPAIPLPEALYGAERRNSRGVALDNGRDETALYAAVREQLQHPWHAAPLIAGQTLGGTTRPVTSPHDRRCLVGQVDEADEATARRALESAAAAAGEWSATALTERARVLRRAADLMEANYPRLIALCVREGGRTVPDALADVREAVDYLRYYATLAERDLAPRLLRGITGEDNRLYYEGRGAFACISPWNFPIAIFTGQIAAALVAGNTVVAKPAHQTPLVGMQICRLLHRAGVPPTALHYLPGPSATVAAALIAHPHLAGVVFTGSTATARLIQRGLAAREGALLPLIAETGGLNAMVVDSSALPEQVVTDVLRSTFNSAGQRCSALRLLCLPEECADRILELIAGAMNELRVGDPLEADIDIGPVIDEDARRTLQSHIRFMESHHRMIARAALSSATEHGCYVAPCVFEIDHPGTLREEVFGPVLHVLRYRRDALDALLDAIDASDYGLTFGIHSRIDAAARHMARRINAGNVYINRDIIGATVGVQPFGGRGLSGTGPKAGGPDYLRPFVVEKSVTINTAAVGGNAGLLAESEDG